MRPTILRAGPSDMPWATELIVRAFEATAPVVWLIPDRSRRRDVLRASIRIVADAALERGEAMCTPERDAIAIWQYHTDGLRGRHDVHTEEITGEFGDRFAALSTLLSEHHPATPHHHLLFMAVAPNRRGEGLGSALLRAHHARLDADGIPAYLVSGNPAARDLYARHGYVADHPILLPDGAPFWPMWRSPSRTPN